MTEPLPPSVPAPLRWVVERWVIERCLAKDPVERYDSTRDLYPELKLARERVSEASLSGPQAAQSVMPGWCASAIAPFAALTLVAIAVGAAGFPS